MLPGTAGGCSQGLIASPRRASARLPTPHVWRTSRLAWRRATWILLLPATVYLGLFYLLPLAGVLQLSMFSPALTAEHYLHFVDVPLYRQVILNSFVISLEVSAATLLLGYPTAFWIASLRGRWANVLLAFVMVPFVTSLLVRNYAWLFLLTDNGIVNSVLERIGLLRTPLELVNNRTGVLIGLVNIFLPYMILILVGVMRTIDVRLVRAAQSLASSPFTAFRRVFLPLSLPGVASGFVLVFVLSLGSFVTPGMLGGVKGTMIANLIYDQVDNLNWNFGAALAVVLLGATILLILLAQRVTRGALVLVPGLGTPARRHVARGRSWEGAFTKWLDKLVDPVWAFGPPVVGVVALAYLAAPVLVSIPLSVGSSPYLQFPPTGFTLHWYQAYLGAGDWVQATVHSLEIAVGTVILAILLAIPASFGLARAATRWTAVVYVIILSPLIVPSIITAIAIYFWLSNLGLTGTLLGVVLGDTVGSIPLACIVLVGALQNFDRNLERAAQSLGAGPITTLRRVTLPLLATAVMSAAVFIFIYAFDELLIALFVSGIATSTLSKKMWEGLQEIDPTITAVSSLLVAMAIALFILLACLQRVAGRVSRWTAPR